jgi:hypothetical protein
MTKWGELYNQASRDGQSHEYCKKFASTVLKFRNTTLKLKAQRRRIKMTDKPPPKTKK